MNLEDLTWESIYDFEHKPEIIPLAEAPKAVQELFPERIDTCQVYALSEGTIWGNNIGKFFFCDEKGKKLFCDHVSKIFFSFDELLAINLDTTALCTSSGEPVYSVMSPSKIAVYEGEYLVKSITGLVTTRDSCFLTNERFSVYAQTTKETFADYYSLIKKFSKRGANQEALDELDTTALYHLEQGTFPLFFASLEELFSNGTFEVAR